MPAEARIPRAGHAPQLGAAGRGSHQDTETQTITSTCDALPNHVLPLARFGAPPAYVTAAWCGPTTIMLAREVEALNNAIRRPATAHLLVGGC